MDNLYSLLRSGMAANTIVMVSAQDLRDFTDRVVRETRQAIEDMHRPIYLTRKEVQDLLHISSGTLYNYIKSGKITPVMVGDQPRFVRAEIDQAISSGQLGKYKH